MGKRFPVSCRKIRSTNTNPQPGQAIYPSGFVVLGEIAASRISRQAVVRDREEMHISPYLDPPVDRKS